MTRISVLALTLSLLATACATNGTQVMSSLATGDERLTPDKTPAAIIRVADATRDAGDLGSAIALYRRAHELAPNDPVPLVRIGAALTAAHAYNDAAEAYRQATEVAPKDVEVRRGFGALLLSLDRPELALTQLNLALAEHKDARLYNLVGVANDLIGRHDVAAQNYHEGLRLAPASLSLQNNLGLSQALAGDFTSATATLGAAAASPQATARTRQNLALAYGLAGDSDKAAAVARTDLDDDSVKSNLAYYAMLRGMDDRARAAAIIGAHSAPHSDGSSPAAKLAASGVAGDAEAPAAAPTVAVAAAPLPPPAVPAGPTPAASMPTTLAPTPAASAPAAVAAVSSAKPARRRPIAAAKAAPVPETAPAAAKDADPALETAPQAAAPAATEGRSAASAAPQVAAPAEAVANDTAPSTGTPSGAARVAGGGHRSYFVQVGAFHDTARAHSLCDDLTAKGYDLAVVEGQGESGRPMFLCRSTTLAGHAAATAEAQRLRTAENAPALLVPAPVEAAN